MTANELRSMYVNFFKERGHKEIASASLLPENDPTVLFTTAGMHPLVPYLLGEKHPAGKRLTGIQKCVRTDDIDEVGDDMHLIFFEMLGNWSLGDYFKKESISMSFDFLINHLHIPKERLAVTVFEGDDTEAADTEAEQIWMEQGLTQAQIFRYGKKENWWGPAGKTGPCGPDTEIFYDMGKPACGPNCGPACHCGKYVEIWNNVFMQYNQEADGSFSELKQKNVDTGMGFERVLTIFNGKTNVYETELFVPVMEKLREIAGASEQLSEEGSTGTMPRIPEEIFTARPRTESREPSTIVSAEVLAIEPAQTSAKTSPGASEQPSEEELAQKQRKMPRTTIPEKDARIICEHIRAVTFILGDPKKISPSNTEQGYILRRLIRRVIRLLKKADIAAERICELSEVIIGQYKEVYPELGENRKFILEQLHRECALFSKTLDEGLKRANRYLDSIGEGGTLSGELAFKLYDTYGFPVEFTAELAQERKCKVDMEAFRQRFIEHQEKSRQGAAGKFAGGLADHSEQTARLHTATHLLNGALQKVLGEEVAQRGSNITSERLRFDFSFGRKVTKEELEQVSAIVNEAIAKKIDVVLEEMTPKEAYESGAVGVFSEKYGERVKVYTIAGYSKEICGGPHAKNTGELGSFHILKEEASSAGVRRIKAVIGAPSDKAVL